MRPVRSSVIVTQFDHMHSSFILDRFEDIATFSYNAFVENNPVVISVTYRDVTAPLRTVLNHEYQWKPCVKTSRKLPCYMAACSIDVRCVKLLDRIWLYYSRQHRQITKKQPVITIAIKKARQDNAVSTSSQDRYPLINRC